ncbi:MAG: glycosyltransferase family 2 protein [Lachnospiraceae bacterium]|nr:glycosyltransferase family 2 protein [Lachnospiraceae bacterium]
MKLVSIIIPLFNCELYIEKCIQSLLNQSHKEIEIIIVDDGSTDRSGQIVKKYEMKDDRVNYFYQDNQGPGVARNFAIRNSRGKYLLFVDADDYLSNDYIEALVKKAEEKNAELTIGGYTLVYSDGRKSKQVIPQFYEKGRAEEWAYRISSSCSRLYRRDFWNGHELKFSETRNARAEDVPVVLYANAMAKNINIVKNPGYYYYQHPKSAMNDRTKRVLFGFPYDAFEEMYTRVRNSQIENSIEYFDFGILKFLAHFDLVIYRKADRDEKNRLYYFLYKLIAVDFRTILTNWKKIRGKIVLPWTYKVAISIFTKKINIVIQKGNSKV